MRRAVLVMAFVFVGGLVGHAQIVVYDGATTFRNSVTAALKEYLLTVQRQQHSQLRRMAQRLSMFTNLGKYTLPDPPRWRTHAWENNEAFLYSHGLPRRPELRRRVRQRLPRGQPASAGCGRCSWAPVAEPPDALLTAQLATLDVATSAAIAATHDTGQLRYNGRRELLAIEGARPGRHQRVARAEHDRGARQDQRRRPDRCSPASGAYAALERRSSNSCWWRASGPATPRRLT